MNLQAPHILLVDDDKALCALLSKYLHTEGLKVDCLYSGETALTHLQTENPYQVLVLDIMMPGISGLEVLQQLRPHNNIPVIMLTGQGDDADRIRGLDMGADDYLGKPCNPRELLARIHALLRRAQPAVENSTAELNIHGISLNPGTLTTQVNGKNLQLTNAEFSTLHTLMATPGEIISKQILTEKALRRKLEMHDRSIDVHISRLRQKLSSHGIDNIIKSIRSIGYQLVLEHSSHE